MAEKQRVLELGVEGGGATIVRTPVASGDWRFHVESSGMFLDENDDEAWRSWTSDPVQSIEEALRSIAQDGSWIFFYPVSVHPEYRMRVWELAQEIAALLQDERIEMWQRRKAHWQHLCLQTR